MYTGLIYMECSRAKRWHDEGEWPRTLPALWGGQPQLVTHEHELLMSHLNTATAVQQQNVDVAAFHKSGREVVHEAYSTHCTKNNNATILVWLQDAVAGARTLAQSKQ
jgi:hypothetical protein